MRTHVDVPLIEHHQEVINEIDDLFVRLIEEDDEEHGLKICYAIGEILDRNYTEDELPEAIAYIVEHFKNSIEGLDDLSAADFEHMLQIYRGQHGVQKINSLLGAAHEEKDEEDDSMASLDELLEDIEPADADEAVELAKSVAYSLASHEDEAQRILDQIQEGLDARDRQK